MTNFIEQANATLRQGNMRRAFDERMRTSAPRAPDFSISRVLRAMLDGRALPTFESEVMDAARAFGSPANSFLPTLSIPLEALSAGSAWARDLTAGTPNAGGRLVGAETSAAQVAFGGSVAGQLGVKFIDGVKESLTFPKTTGVLNVGWLGDESTGAAEQTPTTGASTSSPKTAGAAVDISERLLRQGSATVDNYVRALMLQGAQAAVDIAVFDGSGAAGQPLGLLRDASIALQSGTAFNLATACAVQKAVADNLVSDTTAQWAGSTDVRSLLQQRVKFASTASPIWHDDAVNGRAARASSRMPAGSLLYGDFSEVQVLLYGAGFEIAVDPFSQFKAGITTFRIFVTLDVLTVRPGALVRLPAVT